MTVRLVECRRGDRVRIRQDPHAGRGAALNLMSLGLDVGHTVDVIQCSPLHGPLLVSHGETEVAVGYHLAEKILVRRPDDMDLVLVGQPYSGKSTIFNEVVGYKSLSTNAPGSTSQHTHGALELDGEQLDLIDLPGIYSLQVSDDAGNSAVEYILEAPEDTVLVNVIDASVLSRSLELTLQLTELQRPMVIALNMSDEARRKRVTIDVRDCPGRSAGRWSKRPAGRVRGFRICSGRHGGPGATGWCRRWCRARCTSSGCWRSSSRWSAPAAARPALPAVRGDQTGGA